MMARGGTESAGGRRLACVLTLLCVSVAQAAENVEGVHQPLTSGPGLQFPGVGRVLLGLLLAIALAAGVIVLLKPMLGRWAAANKGTVNLNVVGRVALGGGVTLHVVEIHDNWVVVTEGRGAIDSIVLQKPAPRSDHHTTTHEVKD